MLVRHEFRPQGGLGGLTQPRSLRGLLTWGDATYEAVVPVWLNATLLVGTYTVDGGPRRPTISNPRGDAGLDEAAAAVPARGGGAGAFSVPLRAQGGPQLAGLVLYGPADGRRLAGLGVLAQDAAEFWQRWQATATRSRPGRLRVAYTTATGGEGGKVPGGGQGHDGGKANLFGLR
jgi:hypothetical protein